MSIAGGYHKAVERAAAVGCQCVQVFTGNPRAFAVASRRVSKTNSTGAEAEPFQAALQRLGVSHPIAHDSYLINLASPDDKLWRKSVTAFVGELRRAETLGIPYVVTHPGAYVASSETRGLRRIVRALNEIHRRTESLAAECLLETTAGQGTTLGWRFEHLAEIFDGVKHPDRIGVCFDTCHVFAAGYRLGTKRQYLATMREFDALVGLRRIRAFHLNDSRRELGSRVDRHAHIGRGHLGVEPFRHLLNDRRFRKVPMYLETPKEKVDGVDMDVVNLKLLRSLTPIRG